MFVAKGIPADLNGIEEGLRDNEKFKLKSREKNRNFARICMVLSQIVSGSFQDIQYIFRIPVEGKFRGEVVFLSLEVAPL